MIAPAASAGVSAGAAAGISAAFNAPLAGAFFALEEVVGTFRGDAYVYRIELQP